ncbi:MAG TPA: hypothetical protein VL463_31350 [Kofleriaceae bacterium]|jgi:hypothetical protein|nr:hypothetical protein [Kofleriaceae bacterium]
MKRVALVLMALAGIAHANGRPPAPTALHFGVDSKDMYLQVTFGMLESHDAGATWRWVCEDAINYTGNYDPDYIVTSTGALFATTFDGLQVRRDGCVFASTQLSAKLVTSITSNPAGTRLYAAVADAAAADHNVYISTDDGMQWNPSSTGLAGNEDWWSSLEVAPSSASTLYLSGYHFITGGRTLTLYKSINSGQSWTPIDVSPFASTKNSEIVVESISPDDPQKVVVVVTFPTDAAMVGGDVWLTINGGTSWTKLKSFTDFVGGAVIRKTSGDIVIGTRASGTWLSTNGGTSFTELGGTMIETKCLVEHDGLLWACANNLPPDEMALGKSNTPDAWTKVLQFKDIAGVTECPAGTTQHDVCEATRWCGMRTQLGVIADPTGCVPAEGAPEDATGPKPPPKGCCDANGGGAGSALLAILVACSFLVSTRSRTRRST